MSRPQHPAEVRRLAGSEMRAAGRVLARSHQDDPAFRVVFPDPERRHRALSRLFTAWIDDAMPYGEVYGAFVDGRLAGAAVWLPPGRFRLTLRRRLRGVVPHLRVLAAAPRSFARVLALEHRAEHSHRDERGWYLAVVGVDDGCRGQGIGGQLMVPVLTQADEIGQTCWLATARGDLVAWYERLGFELHDAALALVHGGPTHWQMVRRPRRAGRAQQ